MRLTKDMVKQIKQRLVDGADVGVYVAIQLCDTIESLTTEVEGLRQENEDTKRQLKQRDAMNTNQAETIGQLRQREAQYRELLELFVKALSEYGSHHSTAPHPWELLAPAKQILSAPAPEYHNPADVAALKQAREAIAEHIDDIVHMQAYSTMIPDLRRLRAALKAIDVLGAGDK
jgi:predicted glycoside hydrolase/deacetylase ChbG (UPF0249 family)